MILHAAAERAKEIASALDRFRNYDRDKAIHESTRQLTNLHHDLHELDRSIVARHGVVNNTVLFDDLELLQHSVAYTLQDIWTILGRMPDQPIGHDFTSAWKEICQHCRTSRQESLPKRLETYSLFAAALIRQMKSREPPLFLIEDLRHNILSLRRSQLKDRRLITAADAINDLSTFNMKPMMQSLPAPTPAAAPNTSAMRQPRSSERVRPPTSRTMSPTESSSSYESVRRPPSVSSPPQSPASPATTFSTVSHSSSADIQPKHWATAIFSGLPATNIEDEKNSRTISRCFPMDPEEGNSWPSSEEYDLILNIKFPGDLRFHYFRRDEDSRIKVVCQWPHPRGRGKPLHACLPITELHTKRDNSMLYLCRAVAGLGQNTAWAVFKFPTIEFLTVFQRTFLALRSRDRKWNKTLFDKELRGERIYFAAPIHDGGYQHILRIIRDRNTDSLRLEASAYSGPLKEMPIWTAFVTHHITSTRWLRRNPKSRTVYLGDLKRHVFCAEYSPDVAASGAHVLDFDIATDAEDFERTIKDFGRRYREEPESPPS